ncbi:MAG: Mov34/MPN/PAD-1 family protein [Candidatus Liptonbacteria bacterium]|nr:Mov34/MPN/PAD-1 family protein [Candidatus Liptonbacteria bacterium]
MNSPEVYVEKEPFFNMVLAAIETGKRECLGIVFGRKPGRNRNYFHVTNATAIQCVRRRSNKEVEQTDLSSKNIAPLLASGSPMRFLGDFHSHPDWGGHKAPFGMSEGDVKNMADAGNYLEFIILISSVDKERGPWEALSDGSVRGFLTKRSIGLSVYMLQDVDGKKKPIKLRINAPSAIRALNRMKTL